MKKQIISLVLLLLLAGCKTTETQKPELCQTPFPIVSGVEGTLNYEFFPVADTKSMLPSMKAGDVAIVDPTYPYDNLFFGDIIVFGWGDKLICHRIVGANKDGWVVMGDNLHITDPIYITAKNYYGRVIGILFGEGSTFSSEKVPEAKKSS